MLRQFVIASSVLVFLPFFFGAYSLRKKASYHFETYVFFAPIILGCFNVLSYIMQKRLRLSDDTRYLAISFICPFCVGLYTYTFHIYSFKPFEWIIYFLSLFCVYFIAFFVIVKGLDKNI
jgi:drug/metabolite transporter (DMT)-like permease